MSKYDGQGILRVKGLEQKMSYIFSSSLGKDFIGYGDTFNFVNETEDGEEQSDHHPAGLPGGRNAAVHRLPVWDSAG